MTREYYSDSITNFLHTTPNEILGILTKNSGFDVGQTQIIAWLEEIRILQTVINSYEGDIFFEYSIPRMGKRIDVVILIKHVIFVLEFKVGSAEFTSQSIDQVFDYALDLKYFHEPSHDQLVVPILIATEAKNTPEFDVSPSRNDRILPPIKCNGESLKMVVDRVLSHTKGKTIEPGQW